MILIYTINLNHVRTFVVLCFADLSNKMKQNKHVCIS